MDQFFKEYFSKNSGGLPWQFMNHESLTNIYYNYDKIRSIADWIQERVSIKPEIMIICGSGLGDLADLVEDKQIIPYADIPEFPKSTVHGHKGNLVFGKISNLNVVCMQGRFHPYEGYSVALCTLPIKIFKLMGVRLLVLTNAAGGLNHSYKRGDLMVIKDHMSLPVLTLQHPLSGPNDERFGPRFTPVNNIYAKKLRDVVLECGRDLNVELREGVYAVVGGPSYETVTDSKFLLGIGADAVGMSTAHEAIVAAHCGIKVVGFSIITDMVSLTYDEELYSEHDEIVKVAKARARDAEKIVVLFLKKINETKSLLE